MDSHTLIQALIYLGAAALIVPVAVRLGLGSVLGYLIAGCIIGPWGFRLVTDAEAILHFAEIGVVLMLFVIGLELDPQRLWKLRTLPSSSMARKCRLRSFFPPWARRTCPCRASPMCVTRLFRTMSMTTCTRALAP